MRPPRGPRRISWPWIPLFCAALLLPAPARALTSDEARTTAFRLQSEGMRLYKEGRFREAAEAFRQVININLNNFMAYHYYGLALIAERRYGEAIEPLRIALELQPDYVQAHLALGDAHLKHGDADEARAEYLRALELQPSYAAAHDGLGRTFETIGREDDAEAQYRRAIEINVAFADAYTHLGDLYLRRGRQEDAIELFHRAISIKPDFSAGYTRLGIAYAGRRRHDDAIAAIRKSRGLAPQDPEPYVALAQIYVALGSERRAEAEIQAALALDHDHPGAHLILADLMQAREEFDGAVEALEGLHERGIEDALMRRAVGEALQRARADAERYRTLRQAADAVPAAPGLLAALAAFLSSRGGHRRAADLYERAAAMERSVAPAGDPTAAMRYTFQVGLEALAARQFARCLEAFEEILGAGTTTGTDVTAGAGAATGTDGTTGAAAAPSALAPAARFNLGVAYAALGLDQPAAAAFTTYLEARPADPRAHLYLGNALYRMGKKSEAQASWNAFLEKGGGPEADQVRRLLKSIEPASPAAERHATGSTGGGR
jgi:tetratricopeptide (TPR) repeat protein